MKRSTESGVWSNLLELVIYAVLVTTYYLLVLHLLGGTLHRLFLQHRQVYAAVSLAAVVAQGLLLEALTRLLLGWIKRRQED